ncbi:MAG: MBL fold metallo-hydrolase [Gemmatimonadaceae bacterium]
MIQVERHGDVTRFQLSQARSRLAGYSVSVYHVRGTLIDCGFPSMGDEVARLLDNSHLNGVIVTHWHEDHAGNLEMVAQRGIPVAAHPETLARARQPAPLASYRRFTWGSPRPLVTPLVAFDPAPLEVLHTPGHSADHHCVWDPETRTLFSADLFLGVKIRHAHASEDPRQLVRSLRRVAALCPVRMFDGHRGVVPAPVEALHAKIQWMESTMGQVDVMRREGASEAAICRAVLGVRDLNDWFSRGEYSRLNLVRGMMRAAGAEGRPDGT